MNIHHLVAKAIDFKNANPAKALRIIEVSTMVMFALLGAIMFKGLLDSHKLPMLRMNDMHHVANWMIFKGIASLVVVGALLATLLHLSDKIRKDVEVLDEIEEI